ncbi:MAG: hypothetical protein D6802_02915 [Ardenticatenia bacterium]|nr:MAG: hypothetical protein D6802_02915 [Ardenticatenia bacterium]
MAFDEKEPVLKALHLGVLQAIVYADLFDFPLTLPEIHRYTVGVAATPDEVASALGPSSPLAGLLYREDAFFMLADRRHLVRLRRERARASRALWQRALLYARLLAAVPFVRMVALTGALAMENATENDDIDYLIVTEPGYLWLCRAMVIAVVRLAALLGDDICPNYFLSTHALVLDDHSLFTAHELAHMVPLAGLDVYEHMRRLNTWTNQFLPNADGPPRRILPFTAWRFTRWGEALLRSPLGQRVEQWERERKIRLFTAQGRGIPEVHFSEHQCKGHFSQHGQRAMQAFARRWANVAAALNVSSPYRE